MPSIGWQELIVVFALALIILGPKKLPEVGRSLGKGIREFKKSSSEIKQTLTLEEEQPTAEIAKTAPEAAPAAAPQPEEAQSNS